MRSPALQGWRHRTPQHKQQRGPQGEKSSCWPCRFARCGDLLDRKPVSVREHPGRKGQGFPCGGQRASGAASPQPTFTVGALLQHSHLDAIFPLQVMLPQATPHARGLRADVGQARDLSGPPSRWLLRESRGPEASGRPAPPQLLLYRHLGRGVEGAAILSGAGRKGWERHLECGAAGRRRRHLECGMAPMGGHSDAEQTEITGNIFIV